MRTFILLLLLACYSISVYAEPSNEEKVMGDELISSLENTQANYLAEKGRYEQVLPRMKKKVSYYMHEYLAPCGAGYIATVERETKGKVWQKQKHVGCEERTINTTWTKIN